MDGSGLLELTKGGVGRSEQETKLVDCVHDKEGHALEACNFNLPNLNNLPNCFMVKISSKRSAGISRCEILKVM